MKPKTIVKKSAPNTRIMSTAGISAILKNTTSWQKFEKGSKALSIFSSKPLFHIYRVLHFS